MGCRFILTVSVRSERLFMLHSALTKLICLDVSVFIDLGLALISIKLVLATGAVWPRFLEFSWVPIH